MVETGGDKINEKNGSKKYSTSDAYKTNSLAPAAAVNDLFSFNLKSRGGEAQIRRRRIYRPKGYGVGVDSRFGVR